MNFFIVTLGELIIIEASVLFIWLRVLFDVVRTKNSDLDHKRMLMTSIGLALNSLAIGGIMVYRVAEYLVGFWPFVPDIVSFYVMLGIGNVMFIIAAGIGGSTRALKSFLALSALWIIFCLVYTYVPYREIF
jgi:hypothetical protein